MPCYLDVCVVRCSGFGSYYSLPRRATVYDLKSVVKGDTGVRIYAADPSGSVQLEDTLALRELLRPPNW